MFWDRRFVKNDRGRNSVYTLHLHPTLTPYINIFLLVRLFIKYDVMSDTNSVKAK